MAGSRWLGAALAVVSGLAGAGAVQAQELRVGAGYAPNGPEHGASLIAEYLFKPLKVLSFVGSPRPYVSGQVSLEGVTSFAQAGLIWRWEGKRTYFDLGGGLSVHDGDLTLPRPMSGLTEEENARRRHERDVRAEWGYRTLFHATFALGWRLNSKWAVEFEGQHWSNGHVGSNTHDGANSLGVRAAYRF
ncbi:MAG: acyloxyacyl hydrolase [Phenylobacterium sp.]